jgi:hypothetical protein
MANEFLEGRIAVGNFTVVSNAATTALPSGVYIPAGAVVTGVTIHDKDAGMYSNMSQDAATIDLRVRNVALSSSMQLCSVKAVSIFSQNTAYAPVAWPLTSTAGVYVPVKGELVISCAIASTGRTWSPQVYVGYVV